MNKKNLYFEDEITEEKFNWFMLKRLVHYAGELKSTYIKLIVLSVATSLLALIPAAINMKIINEILPQNGTVPDNIIADSAILLSFWFTLSIGGVVSNYITSKVSTKLGNQIICNLRKDLFDHLMELSFEYYDNRPTEKFLSG